jgi:hypothetical protein
MRTASDRYSHLYGATRDRLRDHLDHTYEEATIRPDDAIAEAAR